MDLEDKILLVEEICARQAYNVQVKHISSGLFGHAYRMQVYPLFDGDNNITDYNCTIDFFGTNEYEDISNFKLVLKSMANLPETVKNKIDKLSEIQKLKWCYMNQYDFNGLIEKGLAIEDSDEWVLDEWEFSWNNKPF